PHVAFVPSVASMDAHDASADPPRLGVPTHMIADFESLRHKYLPRASDGAKLEVDRAQRNGRAAVSAADTKPGRMRSAPEPRSSPSRQALANSWCRLMRPPKALPARLHPSEGCPIRRTRCPTFPD